MLSKSSDQDHVLLRIAEESGDPYHHNTQYNKHGRVKTNVSVPVLDVSKRLVSSHPQQALIEDTKDSIDLYADTMHNVGNSSEQKLTNIATMHFTSFERLIFAISDDDIVTFDRLAIPIEEIAKF